MTRALISCLIVLDAAEVQPLVPDDDLLLGHAHLERRVAAQVLVGEEEHTPPAREGPAQHLLGVGRGADDAAVAPAERLEVRGGVHIGHRDDGL